ncbi:hypothetical protein GZ77_20635 [Endozoicomonas montiporae]|uniref:Lysozyme inhibitor LprI N-terminal domain-containing protein n=1 Tax=Endozoicomonas montiporae TaxID=1027273 RepID=A0A081N328_9GAMM|nr:hypothetical protein GZ77_20635 [Endozoicomonas montiporae]
MGACKNACIVAVRVRRKSPCAAGTASPSVVQAEAELLKWLDELDEKEKQIALQRAQRIWR